MYERAELTLVLREVGILLQEVLEECIVGVCKRLLHLCPVAICSRALLQAADDMVQLITHLSVIRDVCRAIKLLRKLLHVCLLLVLLQLLNLDNLILVSQLLLRLDAVQAANFITPKKTKELIKKIGTLCSISQANMLERQVYIEKRHKCFNEEIYYNIDIISRAIQAGKRINFIY